MCSYGNFEDDFEVCHSKLISKKIVRSLFVRSKPNVIGNNCSIIKLTLGQGWAHFLAHGPFKTNWGGGGRDTFVKPGANPIKEI